MTIPWTETFLSIQGEGPRAGRRCAFIRFGGCNLSCSWCDSAFTWDSSRYNLREEITALTVDEIVDSLPDCDEVVLTGGEPLMHQNNPDWAELLRVLASRSIFIAVETNGTIVPNQTTQTFVGHYSISPKLENAGEHKRGQNPQLAEWPTSVMHRKACLKVVVTGKEDVQAAARMADAHGWPRWATWVMPEGTTAPSLLANFREITEEAISQGLNVSQRIHVFAFGDERGT